MGQGKLNYPKVHWKQWRIEIVTVGDDVVAQRGVDWIYVVPFLYLIQHLFVCLCRSMARSPNLYWPLEMGSTARTVRQGN